MQALALQLRRWPTQQPILLLTGIVFVMGIVTPFRACNIVNRSKGRVERGQTLSGSSHV